MGFTIKTPITTPTTTATTTRFSLHHTNHHSHSLSLPTRNPSHIVSATGKFNSRTSKFDSKNRRGGGGGGSLTTTTKEESRVEKTGFEEGNIGVSGESFVDDGFVIPELPGDKPDFWEGPNMDAVGFFFQYMWAFGVVFALVACGIAVATYNEGATDFKQTPAYKESLESQNLLEEPQASDSDIFESNPTEEAPALK